MEVRNEFRNELRKAKRYEELEFSDDFMFKRVMTDPEICKGVLERILGIEIARVEYPETEKQIENAYDVRGIRLDVYLKGDDTRYDIEMQTEPEKAIGKRARYYQSSVDLDTINRSQDFTQLRDVMVIFICTYDPFGKGRHRYTFREVCQEDRSVALDDGASKLILNTRGTMQDVPDGVLRFLKFVENMNTAEVREDALLARIRSRILKERVSREGRQEYIMMQMFYNDALRKGREEGREEGRSEGRSEGENRKLISQVCRKLIKHRSAEQIAEALEEDPVLIAKIVAAAQQCAPDYDEDKVYEMLMKVKQ